MEKKRSDQKGARGICEKTSGMMIKAKPVP